MSQWSNEQILNDYLDRIRPQIKASIKNDRQREVEQRIRNFLKGQCEVTGKSMEEVVNNYTDARPLIEQYAHDGNNSKKSKKNVSAFKVFLGVFFLFIVTLLIGLTILIKSITPLYEYSDDGKLKLFGGNVVLEEGKDITFNIERSKTGIDGSYKIEGSRDLKDVERIVLSADNVELYLWQSGNNLWYRCHLPEKTEELMEVHQKTLSMAIKGESLCRIRVPSHLPLRANIDSGAVRLGEMNHGFDLQVTNGIVTWKEPHPERFELDAKVRNGLINGDIKAFTQKQGASKAIIHIENGTIHLLKKSESP